MTNREKGERTFSGIMSESVLFLWDFHRASAVVRAFFLSFSSYRNFMHFSDRIVTLWDNKEIPIMKLTISLGEGVGICGS